MQTDFSATAGLVLALALAAALAGCATTGPGPVAAAEPPPVLIDPPPPLPTPPVEALVPTPEPSRPALHPTDAVLAYADRARGMQAPELAAEIQRLGEVPYAPVPAMQLALALGVSRNPANVQRAQSLLQRVQQDATVPTLHALARMLATQFAEQRRLEDQAERQAQQLRDSQRRIDQLNERLEAVRAIERSLPTQPPRAATPRASAP